MRYAWFGIIIWILGSVFGAVADSSIGLPRISIIPDFAWMFKAMTWQWSFWEGHRIFYWLFAFPIILLACFSMMGLTFNMVLHVTGDLSVGVETGDNELRMRLEGQSERYAEYHNNLDSLLGIRTTIRNVAYNQALTLNKNNGLVIDKKYDWYITDKVGDKNIFKVVGIYKSDANKVVVYLLGENEGKPFLNKLNDSDIDNSKSIDELVKDTQRTVCYKQAMGMIFLAVGSNIMPSVEESMKELSKVKK